MIRKIMFLVLYLASFTYPITYYDPACPPQNETVVSTFSDSSQWVWQSPFNGARAYDTVKAHGVFTRGLTIGNDENTSVAVKKYDELIATIPDSCPLRLSGYTSTGLEHAGGISITLYEADQSKYFQRTNVFKSQSDCNGKVETSLYKKQFDTRVNSPTWANIRYVRVSLSAVAGDTMSLTLTKLSFAPNKKGIVSISFDDGVETQFTRAYPILLARNISANFYVITSLLGNSGYMTVANCDTMNANGMDISSHTYSHKSLDTITSDTMLNNQLQLAYNWLAQRGYAGSRFFAYPWGRYSPTISSTVLNYYNFARSINVLKGVDGGHVGESNPAAMRWNTNVNIDATISLDSILKSIDSCIINGGHSQLYFHNVLADSAAWAALAQVYKDQGFANYIWESKFADLMDSLLVRQATDKCEIKSLSQMYRTYKRYVP